jgi:ABC-type transport system involved in cytochrome c biogenesis permease subunit
VSRLTRLLLFIYFLEAGVLLLFVPWSGFWERNFFIEGWPVLAAFLTNPYVRGAISGMGVVCLVAAAAELVALFSGRGAGESLHSAGHPGVGG